MIHIVTLTYRVEAKNPEEAIEAARDLAYEDVSPLSSTAFPEVTGMTSSKTGGCCVHADLSKCVEA